MRRSSEQFGADRTNNSEQYSRLPQIEDVQNEAVDFGKIQESDSTSRHKIVPDRNCTITAAQHVNIFQRHGSSSKTLNTLSPGSIIVSC